MLNQNDPARKGEAVECFLAGCSDGYIASGIRTEVLTARYHLQPRRAALLAGLAWEVERGR